MLDNGEAFGVDGPGGVFRLTSAQGQTVEGSNVLSYDVAIGSGFDTGIQFDDLSPSEGGSCVFQPPSTRIPSGRPSQPWM